MRTNTSFLWGFILSCFTVNLYSQNTISENDYTITYKGKNIELIFERPVAMLAKDVLTNNDINVKEEDLRYTLENVKPAEIIKLDYYYLDGKFNEFNTTYIANVSASTGTINVYFNHPVNTTYAQTQNAVNLSNTLDDMLINYINACESTLDIAIYNSYSPNGTTGIAGAINAAYNRGVQVRVIYDGSTSSVMLPLLNPGIPTLPSPTSSSYGIMHNKFVIFDASNNHANKPFVWTGSTNWTVAQIDGPDKNSAIVIQDQALALGYKIEFEEMWGSSTMTPNSTLSKFGQYKTDNTPHSYMIGGKQVNSYFSPSDGANSKIITAINSANSDIDIATMLITRSDISSALINKFNSGLINLNAVLDSQNPVSNQFSNLQGGINTNQVVKFTGSGIMHHKFMVIDNFDSSSDPQVLVGSHNWSSAAETKNDENMLIVHDANITNQYYQAFAYLFQQAGGLLSSNEVVKSKEKFVLYPNPTRGIFYISTNENILNEEVSIRVYDVLGITVYEKQMTSLNNEAIDFVNQGSGVYFVDVLNRGNDIWFKVVKE